MKLFLCILVNSAGSGTNKTLIIQWGYDHIGGTKTQQYAITISFPVSFSDETSYVLLGVGCGSGDTFVPSMDRLVSSCGAILVDRFSESVKASKCHDWLAIGF